MAYSEQIARRVQWLAQHASKAVADKRTPHIVTIMQDDVTFEALVVNHFNISATLSGAEPVQETLDFRGDCNRMYMQGPRRVFETEYGDETGLGARDKLRRMKHAAGDLFQACGDQCATITVRPAPQ